MRAGSLRWQTLTSALSGAYPVVGALILSRGATASLAMSSPSIA
jgi:hypothetical protein